MYTKPKTAAGATTSSGGGVVYANTQVSGRAGYADKAGRAAVADKAEYADKAGLAENVNIEAEVFQHFLRSDEEDTAEKHITFAEGLSSEAASTFKKLLTLLGGLALSDGTHGVTAEGVATLKKMVSAAFKPGVGGKGFMLGDTYGTTTDSYLEVDRLLVRKAAEFVKLVIRELQSVGGEIVLSPASMKVSNVESIPKGSSSPDYENGAPYEMTRCYFLQKAGDREIVNQFVENDLVRCQTFNIKTGTSESARNRYYWRRVHAVGSDYIDVVNSSGEGTDQPAAGDELVQMGNTTDAARQSVVVLSAYGADAPSVKMYYGVNSYSLENKEVFVLSRQEMFAIADKFKFVTRNANGEIESTQSLAELVMSVDGLRTTVKNNKSEVDGQITQVYSQISQTATQISLKVGSALAERRNLLTGSAFRKQGLGPDLVRAKIYCTSSHEGANVVFLPEAKAAGPIWRSGGIGLGNIHVEKGKTYTVSFWARAKSVSVNFLAEATWKGSASDKTDPAGYTGPNGRANLGVDAVTPSEGWHLYQRTFTVAKDAPYEWISVSCFKTDSYTASSQAYIAHPILIEGTAEDFVCWSASPKDYNYIGGNLLDNTRTFAKTGNLMRLDASVVTNESYNNGCSVIYAGATSQYVEMAQWNVNTIIKKDEDYIFSFMAKGSGSIDAYMWSGSNLSIFAEDSERDTTTSNADGGRRFYLTSEWKRFWVHWRSEGTGIPNYVLIRCIQGGKAWVTMPKLEVGATPTDWIESANGYVEDSGIAAKLLRTGFDIENGKITATADKFEIRNNSGEVTASVNENGQLDVNEGLFKGFVCKKLTRITSANLHKYILNQYVGDGRISFDFTKTGSFIEIVDGSSFGATPVIVLPFYSSDKKHTFAALSAKDVRDVLSYYGQDIIIINRSGKAFDMIGGYLQDNTSGSPQNVIYNNTAVILTCGCSGTISKVEAQWVGRKLSGFNGVYDVLAGGKAADEATDGETTTLSSEDEPTEVNDLKT